MNEIIKGMANASEAIQENFEELSQAKTSHDTRLTTVEQKVVAGKYSYKMPVGQSYAEVYVPYPEGFNQQNATIAVAPMSLHGASLILYQASPYGDSMRLRFKTIDIAVLPKDTVISFMYQFVRIDSGD